MKAKNIMRIAFALNMVICFASCSYFTAAESKIRDYEKMKEVDEAARQIVEDQGKPLPKK